jgi:hypothetical protein
MQDRTSANSMKVLLQRTAGPYIRVIRDRSIRRARLRHVRFAPKADKRADVSLSPLCATTGREQMQQTTCANARLSDHLVGAQQERFGDRQAERLGGREIDDEVELGRLLDRKVARLRPSQNLIDIVGGTPE